MKILLCTNRNPHFVTITEYVETALASLGHDVHFFDDRHFFLPGRLREAIPPLARWELAHLNDELVYQLEDSGYDLLLVAGGHRIFSKTIGRVRKLGVRSILWTIDAPIGFEPVAQAASSYDKVFCGGSEAVELLEQREVPAVWLPFACDPEVHKPVELPEDKRQRFGADVVFVGSYYPNRLALFETLSGLDLRIWGPGWEQVPENHPLRPALRPEQVKPEDWLCMYSAAKVVLVAHYQDGKTPCHQASPKVYEAMAAGAFVLCDSQPDVLALFRDGEHLAVYKDAAHLGEQIRHYLGADDERRRMAAAGRAEVLARHTYRLRMEKLLDGEDV